jgi:hypothetical protein
LSLGVGFDGVGFLKVKINSIINETAEMAAPTLKLLGE